MSKYRFRESDIYLPGTDIPVNRLGIDDSELLHEIESNLLEQAYRTFIGEPGPETRVDEAYYIRTSIACVQRADYSALQNIILAGLVRPEDAA